MFPAIRDRIYAVIGVQNEVNTSDGYGIWVKLTLNEIALMGEKLRQTFSEYQWTQKPSTKHHSLVWEGQTSKFTISMYACEFLNRPIPTAGLYVGGWHSKKKH